MGKVKHYFKNVALLCLGLGTVVTLVGTAHAQTNDGAFSLQISPSPIIQTIKPGQNKTVELRIRNTGTNKETLKLELSKFKVDDGTGQINLSQDVPSEVADWVTFEAPTFSVDAGATFIEQIKVATPANAGFSYSFAIMVSRAAEPVVTPGKTKLKGSVAVFALLTVDRPGVTRKFTIAEFSSKRRSYDYLPANFTIKLKNNGNTIVQPYGNVYIQRHPNDTKPLAVLTLNDKGAYLLPDVSRDLPVEWKDGFPAKVNVKQADNQPDKQQLKWDWSTAQNFRFGRYYAKLVAVYNDGQRDVPVESIVSFWVIPWKLILVLVVVLGILAVGIVTIIRKPVRSLNKRRHVKKRSSDQE